MSRIPHEHGLREDLGFREGCRQGFVPLPFGMPTALGKFAAPEPLALARRMPKAKSLAELGMPEA